MTEDAGSSWQALYHGDDLDRVRKAATSIAAMGFEVRCHDAAGPLELSEADGEERPPYTVEVPTDHIAELAPVFDEIIAEQDAFDELLAERERRGRSLRRAMILLITVIMIVLALLGWLRM